MDQIVEESDAVEYDGGQPIDASSNDKNDKKNDDDNDDKEEGGGEDRRHHNRRDDHDRHTFTNDKVGAECNT